MFLSLLLATFIFAFAVSTVVVVIFFGPVDKILARIIGGGISRAWLKYIVFAVYVTGVSAGVRIWELEKYITKQGDEGAEIVTLNAERWVFELYRTVISTLSGIAWMLLVFFVFALLAYAIICMQQGHSKEVKS